MTIQPDDPIDAREARFARRVRDYTEPASVPVDHAAVAAAAVGSGGPRRSGAGRFGWLFAGAAAVAGVAAVALLANTLRGPDAGAGASTGAASGTTAACRVDALKATVGGWEGAAGHRIGTVSVTNTGGTVCVLSGSMQPSLIDRNGANLIVGKAVAGPAIEIRPGFTVAALVQTGNYCSLENVLEPAAVALDFSAGRLIAKPIPGDDSSGVPPCMGENGPNDDITIQPWVGTMQG